MSQVPAQTLEPPASAAALEGELADLDALILSRDLEGAALRCAALVDSHPRSAEAHAAEARVLICQGRPEDAQAAFRRALAIDPDHRRSLLDLAALLGNQDALAEALLLIERLLVLDDHCSAEAYYMHGYLLAGLDRLDDAHAATEVGLAVHPRCKELLSLRAAVLRSQGSFAAALPAQEAVLALDERFAPAWCEKGWLLRYLGRPAEALAAFDRTLELQPAFAAALSGKALVFQDLNQLPESLAAYEQALAVDADAPEAKFGRATTLEKMRRFADARAAYEALLAEQPDHIDALDNLGGVYRSIGMLEQSESLLRQALALDPDRPLTHSALLFTMLYRDDIAPEALWAEHHAYGDRFCRPLPRYRSWANDRDPDRPLKVGILSAELCRHAVAPWLMPLLQARDPGRLQIVCYSMRVLEDEVTQQVKDLADGFQQVVGLDDEALAEQIRRDGIDILLEISGHTEGNRLICLGRKPAPVQAHWLGYPFTTGVDAMDYVIMDPVAVHADEDERFAETVVRLPGGRFCFQPAPGAPPVAGAPALRRGWVTFGSFNNLAKLTDKVLDAWCVLLRRVPMSQLVLKAVALDDQQAAERLRARFVERGIDSARIVLRGSSDYLTLLKEYRDIDIALDPFPFGGGATSCDALWMGVPVVTLPDWQPASRQTAGFLHAMGRPEWVARDVDDYIDIAARLAGNPLRLQDLRLIQRDEMRLSPLCDRDRLVREMEAAMRWMWHRFVNQPPTSASC